MREMIYDPHPAPVTEPLFTLSSVDEMPRSPRYELEVNGHMEPVYHTDVFDYAPVAVKDPAEGISVRIRVNGTFKDVAVRPSARGIVPEVSDGEIRFTVQGWQKLTVELDGDKQTPLFLFLQKRYECPSNATIVYEKGHIYNVGTLELHENDVVYVEEGAIVLGKIRADHADHITVTGNGIICGAPWHLPESNARHFFLFFTWCNDLTLEGFTAVDGPSWHLVPAACDNVVVRDVNVMSRVVTGDGIDITSCAHVLVEDCFFRAADDCVCIKAHGLGEETSVVKNVEDVLVRRCVIWNAEPGNAIEIGYGLCCREIRDLHFTDCDIVHCEYEGNMGGACMSIHQADTAYIHDIFYEDIRVEQAEQKLFDIKVLDCKYTLTPSHRKGRVEDIWFRDIRVLNGEYPVSLISGFELDYCESRPVNLHFDNINILGKRCASVHDMHMVVELAHDIYVDGIRECVRRKF